MSTKTEFEQQWATLMDVMRPLLRRSVTEEGNLTEEAVNAYLQQELQQWFLEGHYGSAWLNNLKLSRPELAARIGQELKTCRVEMAEVVFPDRKWVYGASWGGGVAGMFALTRSLAILQGIPGMLVLGGGAGGLAMLLKKKHELDREFAIEKGLTAVLASLKAKGDCILSLIAEYESM